MEFTVDCGFMHVIDKYILLYFQQDFMSRQRDSDEHSLLWGRGDREGFQLHRQSRRGGHGHNRNNQG